MACARKPLIFANTVLQRGTPASADDALTDERPGSGHRRWWTFGNHFGTRDGFRNTHPATLDAMSSTSDTRSAFEM